MPHPPHSPEAMIETLTRSLEKAKMETVKPKLKKRPTQTALTAALYALLAARDERRPGYGDPEKQACRIACRVMLGFMKLEQTEDNISAAMVELVRACMMTGVAWKGVSP